MPLELDQVAAEARPIFDRIQPRLLCTDPNAFVAIEPESGDHFLAQTLSEAVEKARERYPERLVHTFRVGHPAAIHFGMQER
jgi:hypothetical protein